MRLIELKQNIGVAGVVRNVGIRCSDSRYLAFLDDDNWWDEDHLGTAVAALRDARATLAYTGFRLVDAEGGAVFDAVNQSAEPLDRSRLRRSNWIDTSTLVAQRTPEILFSRLPRRRGARNIEDWELVYRVSRTERCVAVAGVTVNYAINRESHFSIWK